ncbi:MAG TPA: glycerophosphodiester phosphodiesterase [Gemmatimonadales bacterium]|nr:glycerophosphodiester phosphodiesterase [Gemmatimonadales bacterium]
MPPHPPTRGRGRAGGDYFSEFFSPAPPRILAHRGFSREAPENTLLAFAQASALGIDYLETDVRASADGVAVLSHDADLARLTGRDALLRQLSAAELARIDLGNGQGFCTLADALDAFPGARFNIDIKSADAVDPTVRAILAAGATQRVLVGSFDDTRRLAAVARLPGVATSASARTFARAMVAASAGLGGPARRTLAAIDAVQIPEVRGGLRLVTRRSVRLLHNAGVEVHVWTVNEKSDMHRLLDLGVDGLVTDRPDLALAVLGERA